MDTNIIVLLVIINNLNVMDDDNKRHLSSWFKCPECGTDVMAKYKPKLCPSCKQKMEYERRKRRKNE